MCAAIFNRPDTPPPPPFSTALNNGNKAEQIKQVGNAVAPGVMKAICLAIAEAA